MSTGSITAGSKVGVYTVIGALGAGGMGEVWRARDTELEREVALKLLPPDFAADPERHSRFEREARVLASLNHPNIATLYGLEHLDGKHVLVMELVAGEGLDELISRGPVPIEDAIPIALQIAHALEMAHDAGIVHRDLKPANVRIRPDGTVKVLDFGLAKAWEAQTGDSSPSNSPTMTRHATAAGVILGTAAYMSPEQARGKRVDRRADIWSLGVVLWEMLTGSKLFEGETISDVMAAVLTHAPDLDALPPGTPRGVAQVIRRCLERDPSRRLQCAGDARLGLMADDADASTLAAAPSSRVDRLGWAVGAFGILVAVALLGWSWLRPMPRPQGALHVDISDASFKEFTNAAISPDGRWLAYVLGGDLAPLQLRPLDSFEVRTVPDTLDVENPFFSPDGRWVAYFDPVGDGIGKVSLTGGNPMRLPGVKIATSFNTGAWHPDGILIISGAMVDGRAWSGLATVSETGGDTTGLTTPGPDDIYHHEPCLVPGSDWVLYTIETADDWQVGAVSLKTRETKVVVSGAATPQVLESGHLLVFRYEQQDVVMYRFDLERATVEGDPTVVLQGVGNGPREGARYAVSKNGTLIYTPLEDSSMLAGGRAVVWVDREGAVTQIVEERSSWAQPRISPDGRRLLLRKVMTPNCSLWIHDLTRQTLTRITFDEDTHDPLWHPTGDAVIYAGGAEPERNLRSVSADGTGEPQPAVEVEASLRPASWTRDGRLLALGVPGGGPQRRYLGARRRGRGPAATLSRKPLRRTYAAFSPDGRWLAYCVRRVRALGSLRAALPGTRRPDPGLRRWWFRAALGGRREGTLLPHRHRDDGGRGGG